MKNKHKKQRNKKLSIPELLDMNHPLHVYTQRIKELANKGNKLITHIYIEGIWEEQESSFKAYVENHLPEIKYHTARSQAIAGEVLHNVGNWDIVGKYSDNSILPLAKLTEDEQKYVWKQLIADYGNSEICTKWLTKSKVVRKINELNLNKEVEKNSTDKQCEIACFNKQYKKLLKEDEPPINAVLVALKQTYAHEEIIDYLSDLLEELNNEK